MAASGRAPPESATTTSRSTATAATTSAHYLLKVSYDPATDRLVGVATISARATQNLSRFNLDFLGMTVRSIRSTAARRAGRGPGPRADGHPRHELTQGRRFTTVVRYDGVPITQIVLSAPAYHRAGFIHTDDGAVVAGQPEVRGQLVPGQRPPHRQGVLHLRGHRPGRPRGGLQRPPARPPRRHGAKTHLGLERARADGLLPGHGQHRPVRHRAATGPHDGLRMYDALDPDLYDEPVDPERPGLADLRGIADGSLARQGEILDFLEQAVRAATRSRPAAASSTTTTTCPFALETQTRPIYSKVLLHRLRSTATRWSCTSSPTSGSATAWPWPSGSTSGSTRASPPYAEWLWSEERGPWDRPGAASTPSTTGSPPTTRSGRW